MPLYAQIVRGDCQRPQHACVRCDCHCSSDVQMRSPGTPEASHGAGWTTPEKHHSPSWAKGTSLLSVQFSVLDGACELLRRVIGGCPKPDLPMLPIFHSVSVPNVSAADYLLHLVRMGLAQKEELTDVIVLHTLCLVERLLQTRAAQGFHLCVSNIHRVLLTTMLLSAKVLDDDQYNNRYWASVGGVPVSHLNDLEVRAPAAPCPHCTLSMRARVCPTQARIHPHQSSHGWTDLHGKYLISPPHRHRRGDAGRAGRSVQTADTPRPYMIVILGRIHAVVVLLGVLSILSEFGRFCHMLLGGRLV